MNDDLRSTVFGHIGSFDPTSLIELRFKQIDASQWTGCGVQKERKKDAIAIYLRVFLYFQEQLFGPAILIA